MTLIEQNIWVGEKDIDAVFGNVSRNGKLVQGWDEDPEDSGEPYVYAELYEFREMQAEVYFINKEHRGIGAIRVAIPMAEVIDGKRRYFAPDRDMESRGVEAIEPRSRYLRAKYLELMGYDPEADFRSSFAPGLVSLLHRWDHRIRSGRAGVVLNPHCRTQRFGWMLRICDVTIRPTGSRNVRFFGCRRCSYGCYSDSTTSNIYDGLI